MHRQLRFEETHTTSILLFTSGVFYSSTRRHLVVFIMRPRGLGTAQPHWKHHQLLFFVFISICCLSVIASLYISSPIIHSDGPMPSFYSIASRLKRVDRRAHGVVVSTCVSVMSSVSFKIMLLLFCECLFSLNLVGKCSEFACNYFF